VNRRDDRIDADAAVQAAARALKIRARRGLADAITHAAEAQVARWIDDLGDDVESLEDVHRIVLNFTGMRIERVERDEDIGRIASRYGRRAIPAQLEFEFARDTEALVFQNSAADARSSSRLIAVVDARGDRALRAWFGERHECAHLLCKDPSAGSVYRRTTTKRPEPIEQVVDAVAANIGFWRPVVEPVLAKELSIHNVLDAFARTRQTIAPAASIEACYRAFTRLCPFPLVVVRCSEGCRRDDGIGISSTLRATTVIQNQLAGSAGMFVPYNYRIPDDSVIRRSRAGRAAIEGFDDLGRWTDSRGHTLEPCRVRIISRPPWAAIVLA
jgi:hypothetical protein